ncbi:MAG: C4-dicarboxylate transporter [Jatrophihabitans sp.]|nr:C4-dicarboxylate transporter [Jatrophihabitans sp.]
MTTTLTPVTDRATPPPALAKRAQHRATRWGLFSDLEEPRQIVANLTPNWFASVMGTGIVAIAAATLPEQFPGLHTAATAVWAAAAALLIALTMATVRQLIWYPRAARRFANDPVMAHFYGAVPMAILTVGTGTLLLGRDVIGLRAAVDADWTLWLIGTVLGLACAAAIPYLMFTRHELHADSPFGGWLMPIVPPMVSAATGALLIPYAPAGQVRLCLLLCCYAMFGISLIGSLIVITLIWSRLTIHKIGAARMVPTLWIVLGPLGQSVTATNQLGGVAHQAISSPYATGLQAFGVIYGVPVWGFALLWGVLAAAITIRTIRAHLPFSLTWWSFTFPVGTCVTGTTGLALHTGATMFRIAAAVLFAGLVLAWLVVAVHTAHGSIRGYLFLPAPSPAPAVAA